jgi:hypothetical protein
VPREHRSYLRPWPPSLHYWVSLTFADAYSRTLHPIDLYNVRPGANGMPLPSLRTVPVQSVFPRATQVFPRATQVFPRAIQVISQIYSGVFPRATQVFPRATHVLLMMANLHPDWSLAWYQLPSPYFPISPHLIPPPWPILYYNDNINNFSLLVL